LYGEHARVEYHVRCHGMRIWRVESPLRHRLGGQEYLKRAKKVCGVWRKSLAEERLAVREGGGGGKERRPRSATIKRAMRRPSQEYAPRSTTMKWRCDTANARRAAQTSAPSYVSQRVQSNGGPGRHPRPARRAERVMSGGSRRNTPRCSGIPPSFQRGYEMERGREEEEAATEGEW